MPHFFFDFADGHRDNDVEGVELPDLSAARVEAVKLAASHLRDHPGELFKTGAWRLELRSRERILLSTVSIEFLEG